MATTVRKHLGLPITNGLLGVEIEVEGNNLPNNVAGWLTHGDGSLRGEAIEYVLPKPLGELDTKRAIHNLWDGFAARQSKLSGSFRAGVHVHLNVQDMNPTQLFTLITLYFVLEGPLTRFCGETREGNHFCMRSSDAEYLTYLISEAAKYNDLYRLQTNQIRYSALNVTSLFKYGSLEFRAMRSTKAIGPMLDWVAIIAQLKKASYTFADPIDVLNSISAGGEEYFLERVFEGHAGKFMHQKDLRKSIRTGLLNAQDIAYAREWTLNEGEDLNIFRRAEKKGKKFF